MPPLPHHSPLPLLVHQNHLLLLQQQQQQY
jgi:hypothetical protein